jgi:very-short-patch-repair endonuclease
MRHNYRTSRRYCSQECAKRSRKSTSIEIAVESILIDLGVTYETQKHIGNFICDFVVLSHLVIEADGTFWHSLPKAIDRDNRKAALVKSKGYTLLRLPESKITTDLDWCRQQILESL